MYGGIMKWIGHAAWLITALVSINVGLAPFGFNFFQTEYLMMNAKLTEAICYIILASGLICLAHFVMTLMGYNCGKCSGKSKCSC